MFHSDWGTSKISITIDLLNVVFSPVHPLFSVILMAPDLTSFLAISLASLASKGLFSGVNCSGSFWGAFKACKAFFCKVVYHC